MCSPCDHNGTYAKAQTVNHIVDYEVPIHISCGTLVNIYHSTRILIFHLCQVLIMVYYYYVTLSAVAH